MRATRLAILSAAVLGVPAVGALAQPVPPPITTGDVAIGLRQVANLANYPSPIDLTHANDGSDRIYIASQNGFIHVYENGQVNFGQPFLNLSAGNPLNVPLEFSGEKGLLGISFHPDFNAPAGTPGRGKFYTYTSESKGGVAADFTHPEIGSTGGDHYSLVREWTVNPADPTRVDTTVAPRVLMRIAQPQSNHNGGSIKFGPDKNLYIAMGDGGGGDDVGTGHTNGTGNAQDMSVVYGKMLRIDPLGTNGKTGQYGIPADNPFASAQVHDTRMVYASGLRNPFRASFDRETGKLYVGDVGQGSREEVSILESGKNYGWVYVEGTLARNPPAGFTSEPPIAEYLHRNIAGGEGNAVIGGFVYRGTKVPDLYGKYVFGDLAGKAGTGRLFYTEADGGAIKEFRYLPSMGTSGQLYSFGEDNDGELYALYASGSVRLLLAQAWGRDGGGSWGTAGNWIGPIPNGAGHVANFLTELKTPANAPARVTLDGERTVSILRFNNTVTNGVDANSYIIEAGTASGRLRVVPQPVPSNPAGLIDVLAGTHTVAAPMDLYAPTDIDVAADGVLNLTGQVRMVGGGGTTNTVRKVGPGTLNLTQSLYLTGPVTHVAPAPTFAVDAGRVNASVINGGRTTVASGATLNARNIFQEGFTVAGTAETDTINTTQNVTVGAGVGQPQALLTSGAINTGTLAIGNGQVTISPGSGVTRVRGFNFTQGNSTLDLNDNDFILDGMAGQMTYYAAIRGIVRQAMESPAGRFRGPGIISTAAANNELTGLAVVANGMGEEFTEFAGQALDGDEVLIKYTYNGDANLDGVVNLDDYFAIDSHFLGGGQGWEHGDFNYDGDINLDDYFLIDQAFLGQGAPLRGATSAAVAVPEPGVAGLLAAGLLAALGHGGRRRGGLRG